MTTHLALQRMLLPSAQVSSLASGTITLPSRGRASRTIPSAEPTGFTAGGRATNNNVILGKPGPRQMASIGTTVWVSPVGPGYYSSTDASTFTYTNWGNTVGPFSGFGITASPTTLYVFGTHYTLGEVVLSSTNGSSWTVNTTGLSTTYPGGAFGYVYTRPAYFSTSTRIGCVFTQYSYATATQNYYYVYAGVGSLTSWTATTTSTNASYGGQGNYTNSVVLGRNNLQYSLITSSGATHNLSNSAPGGDGLGGTYMNSRIVIGGSGLNSSNYVYYSDNSGSSWTTTSASGSFPGNVHGICTRQDDQTAALATGWYTQGYYYTTNSGTSWTGVSNTNIPSSQTYSDWAGGYFWIMPNTNTCFRVSPSSYGTATAVTFPNNVAVGGTEGSLTHIKSTSSGLTVVADNSYGSLYAYTNIDETPTKNVFGRFGSITNLTYDGTYFWATGSGRNSCFYSSDGLTWTEKTGWTGGGQDYPDWVVKLSNGTYMASYEGTSGRWTFATPSSTPTWSAGSTVVFRSQPPALDSSGNLFWARQTTAQATNFRNLYYITSGGSNTEGSNLLPTLDNGQYWQYQHSVNGVSFVLPSGYQPTTKIAYTNSAVSGGFSAATVPAGTYTGVAYGRGVYVIYGSAMAYSTNLTTWTAISGTLLPDTPGQAGPQGASPISFDGTYFVITRQRDGRVWIG